MVLGPGIENETGQGRMREKQCSVSVLSAAAYEHSGMDGAWSKYICVPADEIAHTDKRLHKFLKFESECLQITLFLYSAVTHAMMLSVSGKC